MAGRYKPQFRGPYLLVRGWDATLDLELHRDGQVVDPSPCTLTVYDDSRRVVLDAAPPTAVTDNVASVAVAGAVHADRDLSEDWQAEWTTPHGRFRNPLILAYRDAQCVVTVQDLLDRHSDLNRLLPETRTSWDWAVDRAAEIIDRALTKRGRRSHMIISGYDTFDATLAKALELIFTELETYSVGKGKYGEMAAKYADAFEKEWARLKITYYDRDQDGQADAEEELGVGMISFSAGPGRRWWR